VAIGFSLSAIVGIALGILVGSNQFMYDALDPIFQVLRTIPPLAWLPIALAALKQSNPSAIFVIFITAIWPIIINTTVGVQQIPKITKTSPACYGSLVKSTSLKFYFHQQFPIFSQAYGLVSAYLGWQLLPLKC
jgi:nitrate/nitrite transport system permease protein